MINKLVIIFVFLVFAAVNTYAGCNGQTCEVDASGTGCSPEPVGSGKTGNNNWNCCHGYPGNGANYQATGCKTFCSDSANTGTAMCQSYTGVPINKGLLLLLFAGFGVGIFMIAKQMKIN